jgi:hypothetical protein
VVGEVLVQSLRHVWLQLDRLGIPAAVAGGLALSTWKHLRATRDIDVLVGIGEGQLGPVLSQLRSAGIRPKKDPPAVSLGPIDVVPLLYEPPDAHLDVQVDLLLANSEYHREALRRRVTTHFPMFDVPVAVLACEDLVLHKLLAGRLIDRVDAAELLRLNAASLDTRYIAEWVERLQLSKEFTEVWNSALPERPVPGKP